MPTLHRKRSPLTHENQIHKSQIHKRLQYSLEPLKNIPEIPYLIELLNEMEANNHAVVFLFIFLLAYSNPSIMIHPQHQKLQKLCQDSLLHSTANQLISILNKPENTSLKELFNQFVQQAVENEKVLKNERSISRTKYAKH